MSGARRTKLGDLLEILSSSSPLLLTGLVGVLQIAAWFSERARPTAVATIIVAGFLSSAVVLQGREPRGITARLRSIQGFEIHILRVDLFECSPEETAIVGVSDGIGPDFPDNLPANTVLSQLLSRLDAKPAMAIESRIRAIHAPTKSLPAYEPIVLPRDETGLDFEVAILPFSTLNNQQTETTIAGLALSLENLWRLGLAAIRLPLIGSGKAQSRLTPLASIQLVAMSVLASSGNATKSRRITIALPPDGSSHLSLRAASLALTEMGFDVTPRRR